MARENIHTVYDRMQAKGMFRDNPANQDSVSKLTGESLYRGPVPFPKMVYHPEGKRRSGPGVNPATADIISRIVETPEALQEALDAGWHLHPSDAVGAGLTEAQIAAGVKPPPKSSANRIAELEAQIRALQAEKARGLTAPLQEAPEESA